MQRWQTHLFDFNLQSRVYYHQSYLKILSINIQILFENSPMPNSVN